MSYYSFGDKLVSGKQVRFPHFKGVTFELLPATQKVRVHISGEMVHAGNGKLIPVWLRDIGPFAGLLFPGEYEIDLMFFMEQHMRTIKTRIGLSEIVEISEGISKYKSIKVSNTKQPQYQEVEMMAKFLILTCTSIAQKITKDCIDVLEKNPSYSAVIEANRGIGVYGTVRRPQAKDMIKFFPAEWIKSPINPLHFSNGYVITRDMDPKDNIPVLMSDNQQLYAVGGIKKALNRIKLANHSNSVNIGKHSVFIMEDVPSELKHMHVLGGGYTKAEIFDKYGCFRATSSELLKMVSVRMPDREKDFIADILVAKNAFKGGEIGIISAVLEQPIGAASKKWKLDDITFARQTVKFMGHDITGWLVEMDIYVTSFFALYGLKLNQKFDLINAMDDPLLAEFVSGYQSYLALDEELENEDSGNPINSIYLYCIDKMKEDVSFDPMAFLMRGLEYKMFNVNYKGATVKTTELMNIRDSFDEEVLAEFVNRVKDVSKLTAAQKEINAHLCNELQYQEIDGAILHHKMCVNLWPDKKTGFTSLIDPERQHGTYDCNVYKSMVHAFLFGGKWWDGLIGDLSAPKMMEINNHQFYIPSRNVMMQYIHPEKDRSGVETGCYFASGVAYQVIQLFKWMAQFTDVIEMTEKDVRVVHLKYHAALQKDLHGIFFDNVPVPGFTNKVLVPQWFSDKATTVTCIDKLFRKYAGKKVVFTKAPTLFHGAIHSVNYNIAYPDKLDRKAYLAMRNCLYVPMGFMLAHQNDCDGDLGKIMFIDSNLPFITGNLNIPHQMENWVNKYIQGEYDLNIVSGKQFEQVQIDDVCQALYQSVLASSSIGIATNMLTTLSHVFSEHGFSNHIRNAWSMMLQDVIQGVKHENSDQMLKYVSNTTFSSVFGGENTSVPQFWGQIKDRTGIEMPYFGVIDSFSVEEHYINKFKLNNMMKDNTSPSVSFDDTIFNALSIVVSNYNSRLDKLLPTSLYRRGNSKSEYTKVLENYIAHHYFGLIQKYVLFVNRDFKTKFMSTILPLFK